MQYVSIDFETANTLRSSACAIGMCLFNERGECVDDYYSLIRPERPYFDPRCTAVHNINPYEILAAPPLGRLWSEITAFIGDRILVAHNAPFDMSVLFESASSSGLAGLDNEYYCTLSLSRRLLDLESYRLSNIARYYGWNYRSHMALDDALVAGYLFHNLCGRNLEERDAFDGFIRRLYGRRQSGYPRRIVLS